MNEAERISRRYAKPIGAESERTQDTIFWLRGAVALYCRALRHRSSHTSQFDLLLKPIRESAREPTRLQPIACSPVGFSTKNGEVNSFLRQQQPSPRQSRKFCSQFTESEKRER